MTKTRGFELVKKYEGDVELLPSRGTEHAAGYDLKAAETITIKPNEIKLIPVGVKAYMQPTEVLFLFDRSSNPKKKGLVLINSVGVIDSDYYNKE
jgi:dUTP pyrophosphatase